MPTLFVQCVTCRTDFPTPIAVPPATDEGVLVSGLALKCPRCGAEHRYYTKDFRVPEGPPKVEETPAANPNWEAKASESPPPESDASLATGPRQGMVSTVFPVAVAAPTPPPRRKRSSRS
jgi:hypothetical protein